MPLNEVLSALPCSSPLTLAILGTTLTLACGDFSPHYGQPRVGIPKTSPGSPQHLLAPQRLRSVTLFPALPTWLLQFIRGVHMCLHVNSLQSHPSSPSHFLQTLGDGDVSHSMPSTLGRRVASKPAHPWVICSPLLSEMRVWGALYFPDHS